MYTYRAIVERVVDGDTVDMNIDLGFDTWQKHRVRLYGIDAPETRTRDKEEERQGELTQAKVEELLSVGEVVYVRTEYDRAGKYGRTLATILQDQLGGDEKNVNLWLVENNYAIEYKSKETPEERMERHLENRRILTERGEL